MAFIKKSYHGNLTKHLQVAWIILIVTSFCAGSQPLKSFYEARLTNDPGVGAPLKMECNHVTSRCYGSQQCSRTSSPVKDSIWFHNGIRLSMGVHGNKLKYDVSKTTDQGNYQCASKSSGASLSESLRVYFTEPVIDPIPANMKVELAGSRWQHQDQPLSINCAGAGANVKRVTWNYEGYTIPRNHPVYTVSKVEQGMLQEKTLRSILSFRDIDDQITCEDLDRFNGEFVCSVEYEVTKAARDSEPFVLENREIKSTVNIQANYKLSNASTILEPMMAFSPNVVYLLCPLCVLRDVTKITWSTEGNILQNTSALSYINRNADLSKNSVYFCESTGNRFEFMVNETTVHIQVEPEVAFSLVFWDRIEVTWRSHYTIPFRYAITMMFVSGSSVRYTNFYQQITDSSLVRTFLDVTEEDIRFVVKTNVLDPFAKDQNLLETQRREDIQKKVIAEEKPYLQTIEFWEGEGAVTLRNGKIDLGTVKCIKVNMTLTPEWTRSRRDVSENPATGEMGDDGIIRVDVTSLPPPWLVTVPMTSSPAGGPALISLTGPFKPGDGLMVDTVFYADWSTGLAHVISQTRNTTMVAFGPPAKGPGQGKKKDKFPWYILVGVIGLLAVIILVVAILINKRRMKKKPQLTSMDHGEQFDDLDERNMYDYLDYDQLSRYTDQGPHLPPRPVRQTESWPIPTLSDDTLKFTRPKSEMPARRPSETEYLLPVTERSKSAGATPACSPIDTKDKITLVDEGDEGIEEDSPFIQPELRRPSRDERESGYLSMVSRDSSVPKNNNRPHTHPGIPAKGVYANTPEGSTGQKRATVMPSRRELEDMVEKEMKNELMMRDEYVSNDDLSDDTILTLTNDESYASHETNQEHSQELTPNISKTASEPGTRDSNFNSTKPKPVFRRSLTAPSQKGPERLSTRRSVNVDKGVTPGAITGAPLQTVPSEETESDVNKGHRPQNPYVTPESSRILTPVKMTAQLPSENNEHTAQSEPSQKKDGKPRKKSRKKKQKSANENGTNPTNKPSATSKREKFSKHPSGTPKTLSEDPQNETGVPPEVLSPHPKSFPRQLSPTAGDQDQNPQRSSAYMSRTETFV